MIQSKQKMLQVLGELNPSQTCRYATVDENRLPVDERDCITGQEYCSADQFIDIAPAPCRGTFSKPTRKIGVCYQRRIERRPKIAWRNCIDLQPVARPIGAHTARQVTDRTFGSRIWSYSWPSQLTLYGSNIDNPSGTVTLT